MNYNLFLIGYFYNKGFNKSLHVKGSHTQMFGLMLRPLCSKIQKSDFPGFVREESLQRISETCIFLEFKNFCLSHVVTEIITPYFIFE